MLRLAVASDQSVTNSKSGSREAVVKCGVHSWVIAIMAAKFCFTYIQMVVSHQVFSEQVLQELIVCDDLELMRTFNSARILSIRTIH